MFRSSFDKNLGKKHQSQGNKPIRKNDSSKNKKNKEEELRSNNKKAIELQNN